MNPATIEERAPRRSPAAWHSLSGLTAAAGVLVLLGSLPVPAEAAESPARSEMTAELRHAVSRGFRYLLDRQVSTRSFQDGEYPVAVNALVGLALLSSGTTELAGPDPAYLESLQLCTKTLLAYQDARGYFNDKDSRMYGHGFATLFLAELYGMRPGENDRIRDALRRGVQLIERSQRHEGGWDYSPVPGKGPLQHDASDTSITVCQTMALRAARNLGIQVDPKVISLARKYIRSAQNKDGGFRYRSSGFYGMQRSKFPRSAAGVCILYSLAREGDYASSEIRSGIRYLEKHYRDRNDEFPFYGQYYCSQAMFQVGGRAWREYFDWVRDELLSRQRKDGSWQAFGTMEKSPEQQTAMALIVLQLPYRFLPIHER